MTTIIGAAIALVVGMSIGYFAKAYISKRRGESLEERSKKILEEAKDKKKEMVLDAKSRAVDILEEAKEEQREKDKRLVKREERLDELEDKLSSRKGKLAERAEKLKKAKKQIGRLKQKQKGKLEEIAGFSTEEAKGRLFEKIETNHEEKLKKRIKKLEDKSKKEIEEKARNLVAQAMQRIASDQAEDYTSSTVNLPDEDMKGRIIGKEGRNIRTFQKLTGTELIVDETPETVVVSSFNPLRRHIAKVALERLIEDGRIQPARIEDTVEDVKEEFSHKVKELGQEAVYDLGLTEFDPKLIRLIGMLYFRTSYGQNILKHSVEMAHIGTILAEELDVDVTIVKKGCLLHDIGKAVSHDVEGSHVEIGKRIMEKFDVDPDVIEAASSHHEDYPFTSVESRIIQATDAISASRPGARKDDYESYIKRLEELESLAKSFEGVKKAFAIQAGREIRIFVHPDQIEDSGAYRLAKKVSDKIEKDLSYPGEIKVNIIRETRAVEYAT